MVEQTKNYNKELKYVTVYIETGERKAIIFSQELNHCDVYNPEKVVSAGRFTLTKFGIVDDVFGDAQSFKTTKLKRTIFPDPSDRDLINQTLHFGLWDYGLTYDDINDISGLKEIFK